MSQNNLQAIAKDNMLRVSPTKLSLVANSIINKSVSNAINQLKSVDNVNVKIFIHSLAFGTLKPMIDNEENNQLKQKQIEMTTDVMSHSLIYWAQDLFNNNLFNFLKF